MKVTLYTVTSAVINELFSSLVLAASEYPVTTKGI
jgi:hypothetical protein